jgi:hypothetical protein
MAGKQGPRGKGSATVRRGALGVRRGLGQIIFIDQGPVRICVAGFSLSIINYGTGTTETFKPGVHKLRVVFVEGRAGAVITSAATCWLIREKVEVLLEMTMTFLLYLPRWPMRIPAGLP